MELVSVIVPVYNVEKYLSVCIESILAQTYTKFELILVDDGSKDKSGIICDEYAVKDNRIKVIHKRNEGVSIARNIGIKAANGEWVVFVDSDDYVDKDYLLNLKNAVTDDSMLVMQGVKKFNSTNPDDIQLVDFGNRIYSNESFQLLFQKEDFFHYGFTVGKMYNLSILIKENIIFNERISYAEDLIFMLNYICYVDKVKFIDGANYYYRINHSSLTKKYGAFKSEYLMFVKFIEYNNIIATKKGFKTTKTALHIGAIQLMRSIYSIYINNEYPYNQRILIIKLFRKKYNKFVYVNYNPKIKILKLAKLLFLNNIYLFDVFCKMKF